MTHSGSVKKKVMKYLKIVLIPLLLDDPLWVVTCLCDGKTLSVLIPLLLDDPLWVMANVVMGFNFPKVLIPLLLDDPLWVIGEILDNYDKYKS